MELSQIVSIDIETSGLGTDAKIASVQLYFPFTNQLEFLPIDMLNLPEEIKVANIQKINDVINSHYLVGHNLAFDLFYLMRDFKFEPKVYGDSYIFSLMTQQKKNGLKDLVVEFGIVDPEAVQKLKNITDNFDFTQIPYDDPNAIKYGLDDVVWAWLLESKFREKYPKYVPVYETEVTYIEVFNYMTMGGLTVDFKGFLDFRTLYNKETDELKANLNKLAGFDFKVRSAKDMESIIRQRGLVDPPLRTPGGKVSYSKDSLVYLAGDEFIDGVLDYSSRFSICNSLNNMDEKFFTIRDGKYSIHATYKHVGYDGTSRVYTEPSINSLPKDFRKFVVPRDGYKFVYFDWKSAELLLLAYLAKENWIIDAYYNGQDIHKLMASKLLDISVDEVTKDKREVSKIVTFSITYGSEGGAASRALKISYEEASNLVAKFWEICPNIKYYRDNIIANSVKYGGVFSLTGRFRRIPDVFSKDGETRKAAFRQVFNTAIQGGLADLQKILLKRIYDKIKNTNQIRLVTTVFDSFLLEVKDSFDVASLEKFLVKSSEFSFPSVKVKLLMDFNEGKTYYEASK